MLNLRSLKWKTLRTNRERIGLKKGETLITDLEEVSEGKWAVLDRRGAKVAWFEAGSKPVPPNL